MSPEANANSHSARAWSRGRERRWLAAICAAVVVLALPGIFFNRPWCDEAYTASAAWNLLTNGVPGTLNLETAGTHWLRIDRITYWTMPLYWMSATGWSAIFGTSVEALRLYSTFWAVLGVMACYQIVRALGARPAVALLCIALISTDYIFVRGAGDGRFEMMCASLGWLAIATYLTLRERRFRTACLVSHSLMALSAMTHPNVVPLFFSLVLLQLALDRPRASIPLILSCALPYLATGALWLAYASIDFPAFRAQLGGNAGGRGVGIAHPLQAIVKEISVRFVKTFWGTGRLSGASRLKAIYLVVFALGALLPLTLRLARIPMSRATQFVAVSLVLHIVWFTFLEGYKNPLYLLYLTPLLTGTAVLGMSDLVAARPALRMPSLAGAAALLLLGTAAQVMIARRDTMHREFKPMIAALRANMQPGDIIFGSPELAFELGFIPEVIDDLDLGYHSKRKAKFIVLEERYRDWLQLDGTGKANSPHVANLINNEYRPVYRTEMYQILERKSD